MYIRTIKCGLRSENKPTLVLTHGYGGSAALFYKVLKTLVSRFYLIMFDLPGMGGSSRPDNFSTEFKPREVIDYFVEYIEKWRAKMDLTDFYLTAHSYGGYMCGHYAVKYHQHIKKLLLLSPIGTKVPRPDQLEPGYDPNKEWAERIKQQQQANPSQGRRGPPAFLRPLMKYTWERKISPFSVARMCTKGMVLKGIGNYVERR